MTWWTLAYINTKDKTLCLWQDLGQVHPVTGSDWNPSLDVPWPADCDKIQEALDRGCEVECYVPKGTTTMTEWRIV